MPARTDAFLRFGESLAHVTGVARPAELARTLGVPLTTVQEWVRHLRFQRALFEAGPGYRVDRRQLLAVYTAHRVARLTPAFEVGTSLDAPEVGEALRRARIPHAFAMLTAANEWAFYESRRRHQVYVARSNLPRLRQLLPPGGIQLEAFPENLATLSVRPRGGLDVTDAFLTYLDCRAHPEAGAHADFLEHNVLRWEGVR